MRGEGAKDGNILKRNASNNDDVVAYSLAFALQLFMSNQIPLVSPTCKALGSRRPVRHFQALLHVWMHIGNQQGKGKQLRDGRPRN